MCDLIVCHLIVNVKVKAELGLKPQSNFVRTTKIISRFKKTLGLRSPIGIKLGLKSPGTMVSNGISGTATAALV